MALKHHILGLLVLLIATLGLGRPVAAHLDPPGAPAFQETIWLTAVGVIDDMDGFGAGELSIDWSVNQPGHARAVGRIPLGGTVAVNAPPVVAFPGAFPMVIYNHLNCVPPERLFRIKLVLIDDDAPFGVDASPLALAIGALVGPFAVANAEFGYGILIGIRPAPQFNALCAAEGPIPDGDQPVVPPPPEPPSSGTLPTTPELPPTPGEGEPEIPDLNDLTELLAPTEPVGRRWDDFLIVGLAIGLVIGALLGLIVGRVWRRRKD